MDTGHRVTTLTALIALATAIWPAGTHAQQRPGAEWTAISGERLRQLRGGFSLPSGLVVSFGIERAAYVNGELVASTRLNIPDLARMTSQQAQDLQQLGGPLLIQIGAGNRFDVVDAPATGTIVQNTLDGQHVRALTTINLSVGSLGLFQDLNSLSSLQDALIGAPGGP